MKRRPWDAGEDELLREFFPLVPAQAIADALCRTAGSIYQRAQTLGLKKPAGWAAAYNRAFCPDNGARTRFVPGQRPWNSGMKGLDIGGHATRFQPGTLNGTAAERLQPLGAERVTKDGIRQRKVRMDGPPQRRWRAVHAIEWEAINGPIPPGHVVVFRDGDRENTAVANLELITRSALMARNTIHNYPPEIVAAVQMRGALNRRINREQDDRRSA